MSTQNGGEGKVRQRVRPAGPQTNDANPQREQEASQPASAPADAGVAVSAPNPLSDPKPTPLILGDKPEEEGVGFSEFRGHKLGNTLAERYRQLRIMAGPDAALEFAIKETMALLHQGANVEVVSQQFDVPTRTVYDWRKEGRRRIGQSVESFDPKSYVGMLLNDLEQAQELFRITMSRAKSGDHVKLRAAEGLIKLCDQRMAILDKFGIIQAAGLAKSHGDDPRVTEARDAFRQFSEAEHDFFGDPNASVIDP